MMGIKEETFDVDALLSLSSRIEKLEASLGIGMLFGSGGPSL